MQMPNWYARWNRFATNKLVNLWAGKVAGMGILRHVGRKSGTTYLTPLVVFPLDHRAETNGLVNGAGGLLVQVGYGPNTQWLQNAIAAGGAQMEYRGTTVDLGAPTLVPKTTAREFVPPRWRLFYRIVPFDEAAIFPPADRAETKGV